MQLITTREIATYAVNELMNGTNHQTLARIIAAFLVSENRAPEAHAVDRAIESECARRGITKVTITSAHHVDDATKYSLAAALKVRQPMFVEVIDSSVVSGARAETADKRLDLTLLRRLEAFKEHARTA